MTSEKTEHRRAALQRFAAACDRIDAQELSTEHLGVISAVIERFATEEAPRPTLRLVPQPS